MTAEGINETAKELTTKYLEDFDISTPGQKYEGLRHRVKEAITAAVAEEAKKKPSRMCHLHKKAPLCLL